MDLQKLTLAQFTRLVNSTKYGTVMTKSKAIEWQDQGGMQVGDILNKNINLYKFTAWMFDRRVNQRRKRAERREDRRYIQNEANKLLHRETREANADIGEIPECEDMARRESCRDSLEQFILTYIKPSIPHWRPFNKYHYQLIEGVESSIKQQKCIAFALPRAFFKTFVLRAGLLWAILYHNKKHKCFAVTCSTLRKTYTTFRYIIQNFVSEKGLIYRDFPELCYPLKILYDNPKRPSTYRGERIRGSLAKDLIIFPFIEGSPYSGITISMFSMGTEDIRGTDTTIDGVTYRTSMVFIDDPQNNETARSKTTIINYDHKLNQEIMFLAGDDPETGKQLPTTVIVACTCIGVDDLAEQILDHKIYPQYRGIKVPRLLKMPDLRKWSLYKDVRNAAILQGKQELATQYYLEHREELDAGAECIEDHFASHQASGIQAAMDMWCNNEYAFWTEQQQNPHMAQYAVSGGISVDTVTPPMIESRMVNINRLVIPSESQFMASFIDVGKNVLHYETTAFGIKRKFAHVLDYCFWPDQGVSRITKSTPRVKIGDAFYGADEFECLSIALRELLFHLTQQTYILRDKDGSQRQMTEADLLRPTQYRHEWSGDIYPFYSLIGIDCTDQTYEQTIYETIIAFQADCPAWENRVIPMYAGYATNRLVSQWDLNYDLGERQRGRMFENKEFQSKYGNTNCHWIENSNRNLEVRERNHHAVRYTVFRDVNKFKERVVNTWIDGTTSLFAQDPGDLQCYAEHQSNEVPTKVYVGGYDYYRFKERKGANGNVDYFDCRVGTETLCDYIGCFSGVNHDKPKS